MDKQRITATLQEILRDLENIVVHEGIDQGVILLSDASPTKWDDKNQCHVYIYEDFNPLAHALILLHRKVRELEAEVARS